MIKQTNDKFEPILFIAKYNEETVYIDDKKEFEEILEEELGELPIIVYEDIILTEEQQARLELMNSMSDISLDEARDYIMDGIIGNSLSFKYLNLKNKNNDLELQNSSLMLELAQGKSKIEELEMKNSMILMELATIKGGD